LKLYCNCCIKLNLHIRLSIILLILIYLLLVRRLYVFDHRVEFNYNILINEATLK
jgi:hypothetical protein